jgi:putative addiction module killer protein
MIELRQTLVYARWFADLRDRAAKARIEARIDRLRLDNPGDVRPVGEGVNELRIHYGPGYRIYYVRRGDILIVLLCGGDKSDQQRDIAMAKALVRDWRD